MFAVRTIGRFQYEILKMQSDGRLEIRGYPKNNKRITVWYKDGDSFYWDTMTVNEENICKTYEEAVFRREQLLRAEISTHVKNAHEVFEENDAKLKQLARYKGVDEEQVFSSYPLK